MELAMLCRDSDDRRCLLWSYGFEWTVGFRHAVLVVAFPGSVRQQVLDLGDTPRKNVAGFGLCYSLWCASSDLIEASQHMPSGWLLFPRLGVTIADCMQCV